MKSGEWLQLDSTGGGILREYPAEVLRTRDLGAAFGCWEERAVSAVLREPCALCTREDPTGRGSAGPLQPFR